MVEPNVHQDSEAYAEGHKAAHDLGEFVKSLGDLERDHQQRDREGEDGVGKSFETRDFAAAPAEVFFSSQISFQVFADHGPSGADYTLDESLDSAHANGGN